MFVTFRKIYLEKFKKGSKVGVKKKRKRKERKKEKVEKNPIELFFLFRSNIDHRRILFRSTVKKPGVAWLVKK